MRSDSDIRQDVESELRWAPDIDPTDIAVTVKDGVVTLTGFVHSYLQKVRVEALVKNIDGVVGLANDLEVRVPEKDARPDPDIARAAVSAIRSQLPAIWERIRVVVRDGWVTLEGEVEQDSQRQRAEEAVRRQIGVRGVRNLIRLKPKAAVAPDEIRRQIEEAFRRSAEIDANRIAIEVHGGDVILTGTVRSWAERQEAERVAWLAPGIVKVENRITVGP